MRIVFKNVLNRGLSVRPPPATMPIMPRTLLLTTFLAPLGSLTRVLPVPHQKGKSNAFGKLLTLVRIVSDDGDVAT